MSYTKHLIRRGRLVALTASLVWLLHPPVAAQSASLALNLAETTVHFTLGASFHTVHGEFTLRNGTIHFNPSSGAIDGLIVVDATSGQTGNATRDRRMHHEILESDRYPDISFRADRVEGTVQAQGTSNVQVHGMLVLHGQQHEMSLPMQVEMGAQHWSADTHFTIPYVDWGLKNPSTFVLRVSKTVDIEIHAAGVSTWTMSGAK